MRRFNSDPHSPYSFSIFTLYQLDVQRDTNYRCSWIKFQNDIIFFEDVRRYYYSALYFTTLHNLLCGCEMKNNYARVAEGKRSGTVVVHLILIRAVGVFNRNSCVYEEVKTNTKVSFNKEPTLRVQSCYIPVASELWVTTWIFIPLLN